MVCKILSSIITEAITFENLIKINFLNEIWNLTIFCLVYIKNTKIKMLPKRNCRKFSYKYFMSSDLLYKQRFTHNQADNKTLLTIQKLLPLFWFLLGVWNKKYLKFLAHLEVSYNSTWGFKDIRCVLPGFLSVCLYVIFQKSKYLKNDYK